MNLKSTPLTIAGDWLRIQAAGLGFAQGSAGFPWQALPPQKCCVTSRPHTQWLLFELMILPVGGLSRAGQLALPGLAVFAPRSGGQLCTDPAQCWPRVAGRLWFLCKRLPPSSRLAWARPSAGAKGQVETCKDPQTRPRLETNAFLPAPHSVGESKAHGQGFHGEGQGNLWSSHQLTVLGFCSWAGEAEGLLREDPGDLPCRASSKGTLRPRVHRARVVEGNGAGEGGSAEKLLCWPFSFGCGCLQEAGRKL